MDGPITTIVYKIVVVGDSAVGKTCLLQRFVKDDFSTDAVPTIGVDFENRVIDLDGGPRVKLQLWDTAGQEKFRSLASTYYRGAAGIAIVYDITDRQSFESARNWIADVRKHTDHLGGTDAPVRMLLGNKVDLDVDDARAVAEQEGKELAAEMQMGFMETSAQSNFNVTEAFSEIGQGIWLRTGGAQLDGGSRTSGVHLSSRQQQHSTGCCGGVTGMSANSGMQTMPTADSSELAADDPAAPSWTTKLQRKLGMDVGRFDEGDEVLRREREEEARQRRERDLQRV